MKTCRVTSGISRRVRKPRQSSHNIDKGEDSEYEEYSDDFEEDNEAEPRFSKNSNARPLKSYGSNAKVEIRINPEKEDEKFTKTNGRFSISDAPLTRNYGVNENIEIRSSPSPTPSSRSDSRFSKSNSRRQSKSFGSSSNIDIGTRAATSLNKASSASGRSNTSQSRSRSYSRSSTGYPGSRNQSENANLSSNSKTRNSATSSHSRQGTTHVLSDSEAAETSSGDSRPSTQWRLSQSMHSLKLREEREKEYRELLESYEKKKSSSVANGQARNGDTKRGSLTEGTESEREEELESIWMNEQRERKFGLTPESRLTSADDSGRGSIASSDWDRADSVFKLKSKVRQNAKQHLSKLIKLFETITLFRYKNLSKKTNTFLRYFQYCVSLHSFKYLLRNCI